MKEVNEAREDAETADFLLFNTGWDKFWGSEEYFGEYPCIDDDVLDFILLGNYKGIGFDVMGIDPISDLSLHRHKKLFKNKYIINIENLAIWINAAVAYSIFLAFLSNSKTLTAHRQGLSPGGSNNLLF